MPQPPKKKPPTPDDDPENPGGGDDDDAPVSKRDLTEMVNGAVNNLFKRKLGPAISSAMAPVLEQLKGMKQPKADPDEDADPEDPPDDPEEQPAPKGKAKPARPDPAMVKLQRKLEEMQRKADEREQKLVAEANQRKSVTIDNELTSALTKLGVDPLRMRGALAVHKASAFVDDADGKVRFKVKRDGYDEDLDPADALKEWGDTDEGKSYIAASGSTGGAGARAPKTGGASRKAAPGTPEARAQARADAKSALMQGVGELLSDGSSIAIE